MPKTTRNLYLFLIVAFLALAVWGLLNLTVYAQSGGGGATGGFQVGEPSSLDIQCRSGCSGGLEHVQQ